MFRVRWERSALDELADMWNRADSGLRHLITDAAHAVEQRLRRNGHAEGESRPRGRRVTFVPPLAITFRLEADGQTISVLSVRLFVKRR